MSDDIPANLVRRTPWPASASRAVGTPLQPSVVYASNTPDQLDQVYLGQVKGYTYAREGHPNAEVLAAKIDALEGATGGLIVGSGMAAVTAALMGLLRAGDHVIGGDQLYGRSLRLMNQELNRFGIATSLADPTDVAAVAAAIRPETKMILVEVVSNPTLRIADMDAIEHDAAKLIQQAAEDKGTSFSAWAKAQNTPSPTTVKPSTEGFNYRKPRPLNSKLNDPT
jgi:cystathionine gamma-synthase